MQSLRGKQKIILALAGLAGCGVGAGAALLLSGDTNGHKLSQTLHLRAGNVSENRSLTNELMVNSKQWEYNWDKREPLIRMKGSIDSEKDENNDNGKQEKAKPSATRHLILVRHGQFNRSEKKDSLRTLTPLGREQANLTGFRLKELAHPYTRIIRSTMTRATETAQIISQHLPDIPVKNSDFIREGWPLEPDPDYFELNGKKEWHYYEDGARFEAAFRKHFHRADPQQKEDSYEILVCHGNVICYFICRAIQLPPEAWQRFPVLFNGSLTWIVIKPNGLVGVFSVGDSGHMPKDKLSYM